MGVAIFECIKAAELCRTPKRGRQFDPHCALVSWSPAVLRRFHFSSLADMICPWQLQEIARLSSEVFYLNPIRRCVAQTNLTGVTDIASEWADRRETAACAPLFEIL